MDHSEIKQLSGSAPLHLKPGERVKTQRLKREINYVRVEQGIKSVTLGTISFVTLRSFSITISTEFSMASFWKQQTQR